MAKYTVIADIGKGILEMLRDKLVPEPVDKSQKIGICEPKDRGDYIVGIHPYDIKEEHGGIQRESVTLPDGKVQDPPAMIEIYYMISVCSKAELEAKAMDEANIMGKIIQVLNDNPVVPNRYMPNNADNTSINVPISSLPIDMEEKVKIWTMFGEPYKLSVFYVAGPIPIDSENIHKPKRRVETVYIRSSQVLPKKIVQFDTKITDEELEDEEEDDEEEDEEEGDSEDEDFGSDDSSDEDSEDSDDSFGGDTEDDESLDDTDESTDDISSDDAYSDDLNTEGDEGFGSETEDDSLDSEGESDDISSITDEDSSGNLNDNSDDETPGDEETD